MSLSGAKSRLVSINRDLSLEWAETKNYWRDTKALEFERQYLTELFAGVDRVVTVIEKMDELLKKVRNECE
jgi:hypothetical protein